MKKTGQQRIDTLNKRHDAIAREWGDYYERARAQHSHIPLVDAANYINQFRGASLAAFKLSRAMLQSINAVCAIAQEPALADTDIRQEVIGLLGDYLGEGWPL
jgi:hypothetical protein